MGTADLAGFSNREAISVLRAPSACRRHLVFIRCGSNVREALFRQRPPDTRSFDLALNFYAPPHAEDALFDNAEYVVAGGMSKYHAAKRFFETGYLGRYEGVYFLDEDIELHFDLSEFLRYCEDKRFAIAQASLSHASDGAWRITYNHPVFEYRLTNFVEVMAPYFSKRFLESVVETFDASISTYGLDVLWGSRLGADDTAAIVDRYQMSHLKQRELGTGAYYTYLRSIGIDCFAEMRSILGKLGIARYPVMMKGGVQIMESVT
jgi:hypothetical protein